MIVQITSYSVISAFTILTSHQLKIQWTRLISHLILQVT